MEDFLACLDDLSVAFSWLSIIDLLHAYFKVLGQRTLSLSKGLLLKLWPKSSKWPHFGRLQLVLHPCENCMSQVKGSPAVNENLFYSSVLLTASHWRRNPLLQFRIANLDIITQIFWVESELFIQDRFCLQFKDTNIEATKSFLSANSQNKPDMRS